ncbi:MAG: S-layer homology domain-containing protein, partial [Oscillospiraceae bacterium]|nr:S-layer homology domain-containing protein [Oscillospiraceae bacterium]
QVVTFLWAAAGRPEPKSTVNPFADVPKGSFCEKAVLWAVEKGITSGTDATHFSPLASCNRATVVTFLWSAAGKPAVTSENPFTDVPAGSWYEKPILWAKANGITSGLSETKFGAASICNRAQVVTFLYAAFGK